jgi:phosphate transport system substrate-binding protein
MIFLRKFIIVIFVLSIGLFSCNKKSDKSKKTNSPISGSLTITADESFKPLLEAEKAVFEALYKNSKINISYQAEGQAFAGFFNDSVDFILTGRGLTEKENQYFLDQNSLINQIEIAKDAIAFIIPESFPFNSLSESLLSAICQGQVKTWHDVDSLLPTEPIRIIIDQSNSSNLNFAIRQFDLTPEKVNIYAAGSNKEVIKHIQQQPNSIGIISATWINDEESTEVKKLRKKIKILKVEKNAHFFSPLQDDLSLEGNPFTRSIYIIRKNNKTDLGTGFASFIMSDKGQRIILKLGILPIIIPGREIHIN